MWNDLLVALALVMIIEGMMPFLSPARMRETLLMLCQFRDRSLRLLGLASMLSGLIMLYWVH